MDFFPSSPSSKDRTKHITSWIKSVDNSLGVSNFDLVSSPLKSRKRKAKTLNHPLQSNPNLCLRLASQRSSIKRKFSIMEDQSSLRRSRRTSSPTKKASENIALQGLNLAMPSESNSTKSPTKKLIKSPTKQSTKSLYKNPVESPVKLRRPKSSKRCDRANDGKSDNNMLNDLESISYHADEDQRTRSSSPQRERADMMFHEPSIVFLKKSAPEHPQNIRDYIKIFENIVLGGGVIPHYLKEMITASDPFMGAKDWNYEEAKDCFMNPQKLWSKVQKLESDTENLIELGGYEGNWREDIVNPLLRLAREYCGLEEKIIVSTVEAVKIDPPALLPRNSAKGNRRVQVKKVDTILALKISHDRANKAFTLQVDEADRSFTQSTANIHCRSPIITNIEVKTAFGVDPLAQLGIWTAAGFQKRKIDGDEQPGKKRILMPGLTVVGKQWELWIAYRNSDDRVVLAGPLEIGSTATYIGIFQILSSLRILMQWGTREYNDWLEEVVWKRLEAGPRKVAREASKGGEEDEYEEDENDEEDVEYD